MTDTQYFELYNILSSGIAENGTLDGDAFLAIFEGKIKPIIHNAFSGAASLFPSVDMDDMYQDIFVLLWKKSVPCYFLSDKYEKDAVWFLAWCKVVCNNYVTSTLRKEFLRNTETLDDPEYPIITGENEKGYEGMIHREALTSVWRYAALLPVKVEMKLVWYCVYGMIFSGECENRISANHMFLEKYSKKTLGELYDDAVRRADGSELIDIGRDGREEIESELAKTRDGTLCSLIEAGALLGEKPLSKISDWLYKINKRLADEMPREVTKWDA